jgi:hypothetical protein
VYDQLNAVGVSLSYNRFLAVSEAMGRSYMEKVCQAVSDGKHVRFIGDNVNLLVGVSQETKGRHKHMLNMFGSLALVNEPYFAMRKKFPKFLSKICRWSTYY